MHAFTKFKFAKRVFLLLSEKIGISYKANEKNPGPEIVPDFLSEEKLISEQDLQRHTCGIRIFNTEFLFI